MCACASVPGMHVTCRWNESVCTSGARWHVRARAGRGSTRRRSRKGRGLVHARAHGQRGASAAVAAATCGCATAGNGGPPPQPVRPRGWPACFAAWQRAWRGPLAACAPCARPRLLWRGQRSAPTLDPSPPTLPRLSCSPLGKKSREGQGADPLTPVSSSSQGRLGWTYVPEVARKQPQQPSSWPAGKTQRCKVTNLENRSGCVKAGAPVTGTVREDLGCASRALQVLHAFLVDPSLTKPKGRATPTSRPCDAPGLLRTNIRLHGVRVWGFCPATRLCAVKQISTADCIATFPCSAMQRR